MTTTKADRVAQTVLSQFDKLPSKSKPKVRDNGLHEWVPLSGIVAEWQGVYTCLALATGMKCLPASKIAESNGIVLHDWHAEILAIRTFNRYLLDECRSLVIHGTVSSVVERAPGLECPFRIRDGVKLHMYCSEAPCGDASMELTMAAQDDASPWDASTDPPRTGGGLVGREFFSQLGVVRRKPGRRDAPPTLSKSCSDKLALKQCTSLLGSLTSLLVDPSNAYIGTLVVPSSQYTHVGYTRSFSADGDDDSGGGGGRLSALKDAEWSSPEDSSSSSSSRYSFRPFIVETTDREFRFSKRRVMERASSMSISASNLAAAWSAAGLQEVILGGVLQGRKTSDVRGAARTSRRQMFLAARDLAGRLENGSRADDALGTRVYAEVKSHRRLATRRRVKRDVKLMALTGWVENRGDDNFCIAEG